MWSEGGLMLIKLMSSQRGKGNEIWKLTYKSGLTSRAAQKRVERQMKGSQNHVNVNLKHKKEYFAFTVEVVSSYYTWKSSRDIIKVQNNNFSSVLETFILNNNDFFNITFLILVLGLFYSSHFLNWEFKIFHFSLVSFHCIHTQCYEFPSQH